MSPLTGSGGIVESGDLWKWVLGAFSALMMLGLSVMAADNRGQLQHINQQLDAQDARSVDVALRTRALEANYSDILRRLDRIDTKLDNALEKAP